MPIDSSGKLLAGVAPVGILANGTDGIKVSRKEDGTGEVGPNDKVSWLQGIGNRAVRAWRSPLDKERWLKEDEYRKVIEQLANTDLKFRTRRGFEVVTDPCENDTAWTRSIGRSCCRRQKVIFRDGQWRSFIGFKMGLYYDTVFFPGPYPVQASPCSC